MFSFKVKFDTKAIFKNEDCEVNQLSISGVSIGYIHLDFNNRDNEGLPYATAFNSLGVLHAAHCPICAARHLFSGFSNVPEQAVELSGNGINARSIVTSLVLAEILKPSFKH